MLQHVSSLAAEFILRSAQKEKIMSTTNRKEILELLAQGKITAADAADMLAAAKSQPVKVEGEIEEKEPVKATVIEIEEEEPATETDSGDGPNWLRVRVSDMDGKNKVAVNVPIGMFKFGLKLAKNFTNELDGIDMSGISKMVGKNNTLVEVEDESSNERVRIYFE